jgi:hypothetical protein
MEVLAAVFLTSIVIGAAVGFYLNLSNASERATALMREGLHASAALDRVANDIQGAFLIVKAEDTDPFNHPWLFVAERRHAFDGSDRVKFTTRSHTPRFSDYHASDLAVVSYFTARADDDTFTLYRWVSPGLPIEADRDFPTADDERSLVLAEGLRSFSLRFLVPPPEQEEAAALAPTLAPPVEEWTEEWDSQLIEKSGQLPAAVDISLSLVGYDDLEDALDQDIYQYKRRIVLHSRPLDLEELIVAKLEQDSEGSQASGEGGEDDENANCICRGMTAGQCVQQNMNLCLATLTDTQCQALAQSGEPAASLAAQVTLPPGISICP